MIVNPPVSEMLTKVSAPPRVADSVINRQAPRAFGNTEPYPRPGLGRSQGRLPRPPFVEGEPIYNPATDAYDTIPEFEGGPLQEQLLAGAAIGSGCLTHAVRRGPGGRGASQHGAGR